MALTQITEYRHPFDQIQTSDGYKSWSAWLTRELSRLQEGTFWDRVEIHKYGKELCLAGVPSKSAMKMLHENDRKKG